MLRFKVTTKRLSTSSPAGVRSSARRYVIASFWEHGENVFARGGVAGARVTQLTRKPFWLMVMITALWVVKDSGTEHDRRAHADERNNASQYADHDRLPCFLFSTPAAFALRPV